MNYADMIYKSSPEYTKAYQEGFDNCRDYFCSELLSLVRRLSKVEALTETAGTIEAQLTKQEEG
jgi:hypothetical protein